MSLARPVAADGSGASAAAGAGGAVCASAEVAGAPFGAFALPGPAEALRRLADRAPAGRLGRRAASLLRRACLLGRGAGPFDVTLFGGARARLHPRDNRTEKRVFAGGHLWDAEEGAALEAALAAHDPAAGPFVLVDAGANAGLYTLRLAAAARRQGRALRALAIEPDPTTLARLRCNLALSEVAGATVAPVALAAEPGRVRLTPAAGNRGEVRVAADGAGPEVAARPLLDVVREAGLTRIDALKIDLEGGEAAVLAAYLDAAPPALHPTLIVAETGRPGDAEGAALTDLLIRRGWALERRAGLNAILRRAPGAAAEPERPDVEA